MQIAGLESGAPAERAGNRHVQYSTNEAFTDEDEVIARTAEEISYRREDLEAETSGYVRVRSAAGSGEDRVTSDWSPHVPGMTDAPLVAPATPTGFMVSEATESSITWRWDAVAGAQGYVVQVSPDEAFEDMFEGADAYFVTTETSYMTSGQQPETTLYVRVAAGVLTAAAPSSDPGDYLISAWTSHATGKTKAAEPDRPAAPANVRVTGRGSSHLEWQWDEVPGASGYQSEFSNTSTFADGPAGREVHSGMSSTRRRVANLDSESDGYLRVRTFTGTVTEPTFGDWSEASKGTTDEPAPAVALDAPGDLGATDRGENSITLEWDEVDDAETYAVRQRESGGAWANASCGSATADNIVEDTECVASGLDEGTDYDFQVRAIPADDDDAHLASAWSDTHEDRTTGTSTTTPPPPTAGGGMGDLNVRWESDDDSITWIWDRIPGAKYDYVATDEDEFSGASNPCENAEYSAATNAATDSSATSFSLPSLGRGDVGLLCVRRSNDEDTDEDLSFAWGITSPDPPAAAATDSFSDKDGRTRSLLWTAENVAGGFSYEMRAVVTPGRDNPPSGDNLHRACAAGVIVASGETDVPLPSLDLPFSSGLRAFSRYTLCMSYANATGRSPWATAATPITTLPGAPPTPSPDTSRNTDTKLYWTIPVRSRTDVPRTSNRFEARLVQYREKYSYDHDDNGSTPERIAAASIPSAQVQDVCTDGESPEPRDGVDSLAGWVGGGIATTGLSNDPQGITYASVDLTQPPADDPDLDDLRVQLCVRAAAEGSEGGEFRAGPWTISGVSEIKQLPASN